MSDIQYLCSQPQGSSVGQHFSSVAVQGWETDASRGLNLPNMHVHTVWAANACTGIFVFLGSEQLSPKKAQNSASVFTVVIILQFALNQESSSTHEVQQAAKTCRHQRSLQDGTIWFSVGMKGSHKHLPFLASK